MVTTMTVFERIREAQSRYPVNVEALANSLGVDVRYCHLPVGVSGEIVKVAEDEYQINISNADPLTRQRFTLAHELGHYIYHRALFGDGVNDSKGYRTTEAGKYFNPRITRRHESEANRFAASLLMPLALVRALQDEGLDVNEMARRLLVSRHAMSIRIGVPYEVAA